MRHPLLVLLLWDVIGIFVAFIAKALIPPDGGYGMWGFFIVILPFLLGFAIGMFGFVVVFSWDEEDA